MLQDWRIPVCPENGECNGDKDLEICRSVPSPEGWWPASIQPVPPAIIRTGSVKFASTRTVSHEAIKVLLNFEHQADPKRPKEADWLKQLFHHIQHCPHLLIHILAKFTLSIITAKKHKQSEDKHLSPAKLDFSTILFHNIYIICSKWPLEHKGHFNAKR